MGISKIFKHFGSGSPTTKTSASATSTARKMAEPIRDSVVSPTLKRPDGCKLLTVGAGCFWGVEHMYRKHFGSGKGLIDCKVGYANSMLRKPSYQQVCSGSTQAVEALQISFDPTIVSLEKLVEFFFLMHDPTQLNRQGPDVGTNYKSALYYTQEDKEEYVPVFQSVKERIQKEYYPNDKIITDIELLYNFYDAEDYHQLYLEFNPSGYQCPTHFLRTSPKI